jgi:NOL1/NOP2/sun family putative RNA methylase
VNSLPEALLNSLEGLPGFDKEAFEKVHQSGEQVTSIRINPKKIFNTQHSIFNDQLSKVLWNEYGYYLSKRPSFTIDPLFHAGAYYVQEASSMFLEEALKQSVDLSQPLKVLDLCAAPGGKSTLIQSVISDKSLLVSNEVIKTRVNVLSENISKWGAANVIVTNNDPKDFQRLENYFDVIVVDAPCSGSGLFRKDNEAIDEWSGQNVQLCNQRQQRILADVLPSLKENGILIYSTCSYSKEEDEEVCDWLIKDQQLSTVNLQLKIEWNIIETKSPQYNGYGYRFYPDKVKGEGFFIAALKKNGIESDKQQIKKNRSRTEKLSAKEIEVIKPYLKNADEFFFIKLKEEIIALPLYFEDDLSNVQSALYIKKAGIKIGTIIRDELIPNHELAVSNIISTKARSVEVDEQTALQYLRRAEVKLDTVMKGWALLTFRQIAIGWVKILPGRINNYYPKEWRILNK